MGFRKIQVAIVLLIPIWMGCSDACEETTVVIEDQKSGGNASIASLSNTAPDMCNDYVVNEGDDFNDYYIGYYFQEGANADGKDVVEAFEEGTTNYLPTGNQPTLEDYNLFDVRRKSDGMNNFNAPSQYVVANPSTNNYTASVELTGSPTYMHLALENFDDPGGAKTWIVHKVEKLDGSPVDKNDWSCVFDNKYTFMKGNRCKYDPNKLDNSGEICERELDYFTDPSSVDEVFGTYSVIEEGGKTYVVISINQGISDSYEDRFELKSSSFGTVQVQMENDAGEQGIVSLLPSEFPASIY